MFRTIGYGRYFLSNDVISRRSDERSFSYQVVKKEGAKHFFLLSTRIGEVVTKRLFGHVDMKGGAGRVHSAQYIGLHELSSAVVR
jgi:hypothetical protein